MAADSSFLQASSQAQRSALPSGFSAFRGIQNALRFTVSTSQPSICLFICTCIIHHSIPSTHKPSHSPPLHFTGDSISSSMACQRPSGKTSLEMEVSDSSSMRRNMLPTGNNEDSDPKKSWLQGWYLHGSRGERRPCSDNTRTGILSEWKQRFRRLVPETRKANRSKACSGFDYDPWSHAMNFDEGCWQCDLYGQGFIHSMRFSAPSVIQGELFRSQDTSRKTTEQNDSVWFPRSSSVNSIWQRRKECEPPSLSVNVV